MEELENLGGFLEYVSLVMENAEAVDRDLFFFFTDTATTEIYTTEDTLSLHDALPISVPAAGSAHDLATPPHLAAFRLHQQRSEEHTSELQSPSVISYAVFCLKKK